MDFRTIRLPLILLVLSAALTIRGWRDQKYLDSLERVAAPRGGGALGAIDVSGVPFSLTALKAEQIVIFVLHQDRLNSEITFWRKALDLLRRDTGLVGVCDSAACSSQIRVRADIPFPVIQFGSYQALLTVLKQDQAGRIAAFDRDGNVVFTVPKMATPELQGEVVVKAVYVSRH